MISSNKPYCIDYKNNGGRSESYWHRNRHMLCNQLMLFLETRHIILPSWLMNIMTYYYFPSYNYFHIMTIKIEFMEMGQTSVDDWINNQWYISFSVYACCLGNRSDSCYSCSRHYSTTYSGLIIHRDYSTKYWKRT